MSATVQPPFAPARVSPERGLRSAPPPSGRSLRQSTPPQRAAGDGQRWLVDLTALARCRVIFAGHPGADEHAPRPSQLSTMDVPAPYDAFCRAHFNSVRRIQPALTWEDACPAYTIALSAHAALCIGLDGLFESRLEHSWSGIRGQSTLTWQQARSLIADGCSALNRLDPLAMRR